MDTGTGVALILSASAVVIAGVAAFYAAWQAKSAHENTELVRQAREDQLQPYVYPAIKIDPDQQGVLLLTVRNGGQTIARSVRVTISPPVAMLTEGEELEDWTLSALAPGVEVARIIGIGHEVLARELLVHTLRATAVGPLGPTEAVEYQVDLATLREISIAQTTAQRIESRLRDISKSLAQINSTLELVYRSTETHRATLPRQGDGHSSESESSSPAVDE